MALFKLRFPAVCRTCGRRLPAGSFARWHHVLGVECLECDDRSRGLTKTTEPLYNEKNEGGSNENSNR